MCYWRSDSDPLLMGALNPCAHSIFNIDHSQRELPLRVCSGLSSSCGVGARILLCSSSSVFSVPVKLMMGSKVVVVEVG